MHLHHRLLSLGFTHKGAVMTIYALALVFPLSLYCSAIQVQ